jgi:hypothetical protein
VPKELLPGAGPFPVRAVFQGTSFYLGSTDARDVQLTSRTRLTLEAGVLPRGQPADLLGRLVDERGRGLEGERVQVTLGNATFDALTDGEGRFAARFTLPAAHPLGGLVAEARYAGGRAGLLEAAEPAVATAQVVAATRLTVPARVQALGPLLLNGSLRDDRGLAVPGAKLNLFLDKAPLGFAVTDLQGEFETEVPLPEGTGPGTRELRVRFAGTGTLGGAEVTSPLRLLSPSVVTLRAIEPLVRGQTGTVEATLEDPQGHGLPNRQLELRIAGTPVGVGVTDSRGVARIGGKPPGFLEPSNVTVEVVFAGDDGYMPGSDEERRPLVVRTDLTLDVPGQVERGRVFRGGITVRDDTGRPLAQHTVVVHFSGFAYPVALLTDDAGRANFTGRMADPGQGVVTVRFAGTAGYSAAEQTLTVQSRVPVLESPALLGLAVLAIAAALAASVLMAKRFRRAQVMQVQAILREAEERLLMATTEYQASILWAYRRLVQHMREQGFLVQESFTARELVAAMGKAMPVDQRPLEALAEVFEEARYSPHPIGPAQRDQALAALRAIEKDLRVAVQSGLLKPGQEAAHG